LTLENGFTGVYFWLLDYHRTMNFESVGQRTACPIFITGNPAPAKRDFTSFS